VLEQTRHSDADQKTRLTPVHDQRRLRRSLRPVALRGDWGRQGPTWLLFSTLWPIADFASFAIFAFTGLDATRFLDEVKKGTSDGEMLKWVLQKMRPARQPCEIAQWSFWLESIGPATAKGHAWLAGRMNEYGPDREDIRTYCEHLDLDDFVSFGGRS
jgi:hypothetical protein